MKIGIPRALEYFRNRVLWSTFFSEMGVDVVVSPPTDAGILKRGTELAVDESCLPAKIYMGHVDYLTDKCDYILTPRLDNFGKGEQVCVKFNAVYDIVKNTLSCPLLDYNVDALSGATESRAYLELGRTLGLPKPRVRAAYKKARLEHRRECERARKQTEDALTAKSPSVRVLVVGHPYNVYDRVIGAPLLDGLKKLGAAVILANECGGDYSEAARLSRTLYWTFNKELLGAVARYKSRVDGIILLTAFPCGPDSLTSELLIRKLKDTPILNIIADEHTSPTGLNTRIESFIDILHARRGAV